MAENKIFNNHSLEEYKKRYRNNKKLLKYSKDEVRNYDLTHLHYHYEYSIRDHVYDNYLLKNRNWWLIDNTYYEIPKTLTWKWFRNLRASTQIATCVLLTAGVTSAVVFPVLAANKKTTDNLIIDEEIKKYVDIEFDTPFEEGKECTVTLAIKSTEELKSKSVCMPTKLKEVKTGDVVLPEYNPTTNTRGVIHNDEEPENYYTYTLSKDLKSSKLFIKKIVGKVSVQFDIVALVSYELVSYPSKTTYLVGEEFNTDGLYIKGTMSDGSVTSLTPESITYEDKHRFVESEVGCDKTVDIKYKDKTFSYNIAVAKKEANDNSELKTKIEESPLTETSYIRLNEGEFTTYGTNYCHNRNGVELYGIGDDKTKFICGGTGAPDYSFENSDVTFCNMCFEPANLYSNYAGFVRAVDVTFVNCTINGSLAIFGTNKATFKNCKFNIENPDYYNIWTYSAIDYEFDNCEFNCQGQCLNLYRDFPETINITCKNSVFKSTIEEKAAFNIKNLNGGCPSIINISNCQFTGFKTGTISGSDIFEVKTTDDNITKITVDNVVIWENGHKPSLN